MKKLIFTASILAVVLFVSGCVSPRVLEEKMEKTESECAKLREEVHRRDMELLSVKLASERENAILKLKLEQQEKEFASVNAKLAGSVPLDELFPGNYQFPRTVLQKFMKKIAPPENPTREQVIDFLEKLSMTSNMNIHSDYFQKAVFAEITRLAPEYLKEILQYSNNNTWINNALQQYSQTMSRQELRQWLKDTEGTQAEWVFWNRFQSTADASDRDFILPRVWKNSNAMDLAIRLGMEKELLPELRKRVLENPSGYAQNETVLNLVLKNVSPEEKNRTLDTIWREALPLLTARNDVWSGMRVCGFLASLGYVPAFEKLPPYLMMMRNNGNLNPRLSTMFPVPEEDLGEWIYANKGKIIFDGDKGRYAVAEQKDSKLK